LYICSHDEKLSIRNIAWLLPLPFLGEVVNFLHLRKSLNSSIYFTLNSFDSNFNYVKAQISVLVPLHTLSAFLICFRLEMKNYPQFCFCVIMAVSVLSIN